MNKYEAMSGFALIEIVVEASSPEEASKKVMEKLQELREHLGKCPEGTLVEIETDDMENVNLVEE